MQNPENQSYVKNRPPSSQRISRNSIENEVVDIISERASSLRISQNALDLMRRRMFNGRGANKIVKNSELSKIKQEPDSKKQTILCQICASEYQTSNMFSINKCIHKFCQNCLKNYIVFKLTFFQKLLCPHDTCEQTLSKQTQLYKSLPQNLKIKYEKNNQFYLFLNKKGHRPCPKEQCFGVIDPSKSGKNCCSLCKVQFCTSCWDKVHQGNCDQTIAKKIEINMGFRRCSKCKMIVQKTGGCQHMSCRCGYQFCYICGGQWQSGHICPLPQIPQGLNVLQSYNWRIQNRADSIAFFHTDLACDYIRCLKRCFDNNGSIKLPQLMLFIIFIYPLSIMLLITHIFYIFVGIHVFFILLFIILTPCWISQLYTQHGLSSKISKQCKIALIIIAVLIFPITILVTTIYSFCYFWVCNCTNRGGLVTTLGKQLHAILIIFLAPCLVISRI